MDEMSFEELQQIVSVCLDEIYDLKAENASLKEGIGRLNASIRSISEYQKELANTMRDLVDQSMAIAIASIDNRRYEWEEASNIGVLDESVYYPQFYEIGDTVRQIVENRCSLARYGDGEFSIMANKPRQKFQKVDEILATRLKEVIASEQEGLLVAIADNYGSLEKYNEEARIAIRIYMSKETRLEHRQFLDLNRRFHNAYISRPYALMADNNTDGPKCRFDMLKQIWDGRKIIFVEGLLTRLGVGNDLFNNALQIQRIEAPAENSFDKYNEILNACLKHGEKDTLFLIALGPSAGVLAYDLHNLGYQAVDIGHLDMEYEWFLNGNGGRCAVRGKYNNEVHGGNIVEEIRDEKYESEILEVIS